jgi:copper(I)-binding protein
MMRLIPLLLLALFAAPSARAQLQMVSISDPWIRFITPASPAGGFFTITNAGAKPVVITSATSPACRSMALHQTHQEGGMSRMDPVEQVTVPAHGSVKFEPGGYHLMCMSPSGDLHAGSTVPVTLRFQDKREITKPFVVRTATGK